MKRRFALLLAVFLLVVAVAVPCMAATVDIQDYEYKVDVSGDNSIVYVSIPVSVFEGGQLRLWENDLTTLLTTGYGDKLTFQALGLHSYGLSYVPTRQNKISVLDIPNGTELSITGRFDYTGSYFNQVDSRLTVDYFDRDGNSLGNQVIAFESRPLDEPVFTFVLQKPDDAYSMGLTFVMRDVQFTFNSSVTWTIESIDMAVTYDSLVYMQQQTGRTNKLLDKVLKQFDDFLNGPDDIEIPIFDESMNNAIQSEQNIMDRLPMQSVLEEFRNKESLVADGMQANTLAFMLFTSLWEKFFTFCTWYEFLCYFALVVGSLMAFVGITSAFISRKGNGNE